MPIFQKLISKVRWQYAIEIALMIVLGWFASSQFANFDPTLHLGGSESENVTSSAHFLYSALNRYGYIPYWQPYSNEGQPLVDEANSIITNPFNFIPVILFGDNNGIKVAVILHFMIAGIGGWFLAQSLGMGTVGRVLLGALLIVKGNMQGALGAGYFQLGVPQAYFPWILAGALGIVRRRNERWPLVLFALSFALMFFCTELYFSLPLMILAFFCLFAYAVRFQFSPFRVQVDVPIVQRFIFAGILTAGLIAVTALTIGLNYSLVWHHASMNQFPDPDVGAVLYQFIYPGMLFKGLFSEFSYSYVIPLWFIALIFVFIPPLRSLHRSADPRKDKPLWWIGVGGFLFFLGWGLTVRPFVPWIYEHIPLVGQWRFPDRMLGVATFLFIFLIAFRADGLHRALVMNFRYKGKRTGSITKFLVVASVFLAAAAVLVEVYQNYFRWGYLHHIDEHAEECIAWMRERYPDDFLIVQRRDFQTMVPFITQGVRMSAISADYYINGVEPTIYVYELNDLPAPYYMPSWDQSAAWLREEGYIPVEGTPPVSLEYPDVNCIWRNPNAPTYAFSVPLTDLQEAPEPLPMNIVSPVTLLARLPEHIWLEAQPNPTRTTVVVAQDVAYPGWTVLVNGEPAKLESVGRLLGVQLLPGSSPQRVEFIYTAPTLKLGGMITIITIFGSIFYLLRGERLVEYGRRRSRRAQQAVNPLPQGAAVPVPQPVPFPVPVAQPAMAATPPTPQAHTNGHHVVAQPVNGTQFIYVEAEAGAEIVLPPSDKPYHVEVIAPSNRNAVVTRVTLAGAVVVLAYLVVSQTRKK